MTLYKWDVYQTRYEGSWATNDLGVVTSGNAASRDISLSTVLSSFGYPVDNNQLFTDYYMGYTGNDNVGLYGDAPPATYFLSSLRNPGRYYFKSNGSKDAFSVYIDGTAITISRFTKTYVSNAFALKGTFIETITATYNAYTDNADNNGKWYVRGGIANTAPTFTQIAQQAAKKDEVITINLANYFADAEANTLTYTVSSNNTDIATVSIVGSTLTVTGRSIGNAVITVTASDSKLTTSQSFTMTVTNSVPTVAVTSPTANVTLYENDTFNIAGTASDTDIGNTVTVRYQINATNTRAIKAFLSTGELESFGKTLTFRGGSLYDGDTLIASNLSDGVAHTLKVWATDDQDGTSVNAERTFYVVPNRAPSLTVNHPVIDGLIDNDTFTIDGSFADADGNQATVKYHINGGNSVQVAQGISGDFDFNVKFGQLNVGTNAIVVEVSDSYGAKTSRTVRLTKSENVTEISRSVARYKVDPPKGEAQEMLVWIQHDAELTLDVSASMTIDGEVETFFPMTEGTQVTLESGLVESEFYIDAGSAKDNIVLQIDMTKTSADADEAITLITGVF